LEVSYEVLCHDSHPISASDLFSMVNTGLYQMATGHGDPPILGVENIVISQLFKREREAYKVQLNVEFPEEMDSSEINRWKESYLAGIHERELFKNGSFVPTETTFHFEPISQAEYPDLIAPSSHARDV